ncbi:MAG: hypothetical protein PVJ02_03555 [Gemmatimonadota bacterium]|jgi:hypothetical protein
MLAAVLSGLPGCGQIFDNPTPNNVFLTVAGQAGRQVEIVTSSQFLAGVDERGVTTIRIFGSDTMYAVLPVDTVFDISVDRRWFVQLTPTDSTQATYQVRVDVDDRNQVNETGVVYANDPWRYAYMFNQQLTRSVDVVF